MFIIRVKELSDGTIRIKALFHSTSYYAGGTVEENAADYIASIRSR